MGGPPKIGVFPPKSSILIGFGTIINPLFSPSFLGEKSPYFWVDTNISQITFNGEPLRS